MYDLLNMIRTHILLTQSFRRLFLQAKAVIEKQKSNHVSMTDCINIAIAKEKKIKMFLSFDKVYEQNRFMLVK